MKNFQSALENFHTRLWQFHIPVPNELAALFIEGENKRMIYQISGGNPFPAALMKSKA